MPPPDLPVGIFAGHRIVRPIASGGAGSVLLATSADGAPRALKLVARSGIAEQLFAQEIAALRALADVPQVVHYRAHGETEEWLWLTLEWLEGDTLARVLERDGLSLARTTAVGLELSHALVALHERGIVHRDLKPSNVMCCSDGRVKLLDFGIAADSGRPLSHWGPGTPGYMAPEQARGGGTVDARSDLFALGCILFECLTGRPAFAWRGRTATLARVVLQEVPRVSELRPGTPAPLVDLVGRLLAKDPEARPRSAAEVREILTSVAAQDGQADVVLRPPPAPDNGEQRVLSVIAVRASETAAETLVEEPADDDDDLLAILSEAALRHRGQLEHLVDWTSMVILSDTLAHELAQRAMRCAEEIQEAAPWARVAVATGQATWAGGQPVGEVTDSVLAALAAATPGQLRSDAMTRTLAGLASATPRRTKLVGRRAELRRLVAALRAVVRQRSAAKLVVAGRPGQGKSALLDAFQARVRRLRVAPRVLAARAEARSQRLPLAVLASLIAQLPVLEGLSEEQRSVLAVAHAPTRWSADGERFVEQVARAFGAALALCGERGPVLLVVDDAQWCDRSSLRILAGSDRADGPPWSHAAVLTLFGTRAIPPPLAGTPTLTLAPLTNEEAAALWARHRGAHAVAAAAVKPAPEVVAAAAGNPLLVELLARAPELVTSGATTVLIMLQTRLGALTDAARIVARHAAVFGRRFTPELVRHLLASALPDDSLRAALGELERERIVIRDDPERGLSFAHDLWRDAAYRSLTSADRAAAHHLAATWWIAREGPAAVIAGHFRDAGQSEASVWFARAAAHAYAAGDFTVALEHARDAGTAAGATWAADVACVHAGIALWRGDFSRAREQAELAREALGNSLTTDPRWLHATSIVIQATGRLGDVAALATLAQELARADVSLDLWCVLGREQLRVGDHAALERTMRHAEARVADSDERARADHATLQAHRAMLAGDFLTAASWWERARAAFDGLGDRAFAISTAGEAAFNLFLLGDHDEAEQRTRAALSQAERHGYEHIVAWLWGNLGWIAYESERTEEAHRAAEESLARLRQLDDARLTGTTLALMALNAPAAAEAPALAARACESLAPFPPLLGVALAARARAELARDELAAAATAVAAGVDLRRELGQLEEGAMELALAEALVAERSAEPRARAICSEALASLRAQAARLGEAGARFIRSKRAHRELLELERRLAEPAKS